MTYINPISGTAMSAALQQEQLSAEKTRQLQKKEELRRKAVAEADHFEHAVEHAEEISAIHDDEQRKQDPRQSPAKKRTGDDETDEDDRPHIDLLG